MHPRLMAEKSEFTKDTLSFGVLFMFVASFFFSLMSAFVKVLTPDISPVENMFFRSLFMAVFVGFLILARREKIKKKPGGWLNLWTRAIMGGISMVAFFYNIAHLSLATATTFSQSTALYTVFLAAIILKDKISIPTIMATILGFIGVFIICNPKESHLSPLDIIMGLLSGCCTAFAMVTLRTLKDYFYNHFIVFFFGFSMVIVAGIFFFLPDFVLENSWKMPNSRQWLFLLLVGLTGTLGQHFLTKAYMCAPPGIIAPIDYLKIVWGIFMGVYLGDDFPDTHSQIGMILIVFAGLCIAAPVFLHDIKKLRKTA